MARPFMQRSTGATAQTGWRHGFRFSGFSIVILGILVLAVVVLSPTLHTLIGERQKIADLQEQLDAQKNRVDGLSKELARWDDPSYIRAQARDRLLYVMPGDTSYLVINDLPKKDGAGSPGVPVSSTIQKTPSNWLGTLLGSIVTAGVTTEPTGKTP